MLGSILGPLGMGNAVLRFAGSFLGGGDSAAARHVTTRCVMIGLGGVMALALLLVALHPAAEHFLSAWPTGIVNATLIAIWLGAAGAVLLFTSSLRAFGRIGAGAVAEITLPRMALLATIGVLYCVDVTSLTAMLAAAASVNVLAAAWSLFALVRAMPAEASHDQVPTPVPTARIFDFAVPLLGSNVLFQLMTDITLLFVACYCQVEEVALYGAAYRVWGFLGLPQNAVASAIQGRIAELHAANDRRGLEDMVRSSANLATLPTFLITLIVCVAAGPLLGLLFGEFYAGGHAALMVLCLAQLAFVAIGPCEHLLAMSGKQRTVLSVTIVAALLAVAFSWILTPTWGIVGAAVGAAVATVAFKVLLAWQAYKQMDIRSWVTLSPRGDADSPTLLPSAAARDTRRLKG